MEKSRESGPEDSKLIRKYDLVETQQYLFVRVVRARGFPNPHDIYVEVLLGNMKATTRFSDIKFPSPEWNQVYAFEAEKIQSFHVDIVVKDSSTDMRPDAFIGRVRLIIAQVPKRVPPESALAPQWYRIAGSDDAPLATGDVMLSLWMGTQADEYFPEAWCSDATRMTGDAFLYTRSKVYMTPTLWYLRVNVIQARDLLLRFDPETADLFVQVDLGGLRLRTGFSKNKNEKPVWNEDLMFVAQEPFTDTLVLSVEQGTLANHVCLGKHYLELKKVIVRLDGAGVDSLWYNLDETHTKEVKFASKLNARISLDGAYHVIDEPVEFSSDFRASSKKRRKPSIGVLELGILKATGLVPMKMGLRTDAYCVAKYGQKWVRTRTIVDSLSPKWNEQYMWEVFEPFTVITIAVFDNNQLDPNTRGARDEKIAKIRIRLSTLDRNKVYTHSYPLISLHPSGVKKMGELHLAVRFSWPIASSLNMCKVYTSPLFPIHHYLIPLSPSQLDNLRNQAAHAIAQSLARAELPLGKEVVHYMLDIGSDMWSMRKGIINYKRAMSFISYFVSFRTWLEDIRSWKNPVATVLFAILCLLVVWDPEPVLPLVSFYLFWTGLKSYFKRPKHPGHIDAKLCGADTASPEDLEEELDVFPTQIGGESLRRRYDRLRIIARDAQGIANDLATMGEKLQSLTSWRDQRATKVFFLLCCVGLFVTYSCPTKTIICIWIFLFYLSHPMFKSSVPSIPKNFFDRMCSKQALIL